MVFGQQIQFAPEKPVQQHHKNTHHTDTEGDAVKIPCFGHLFDVTAQPVGNQRGFTLGDIFRNDTGIPRAAAGGNRTGDVTRENRWQINALPFQPAFEAQIICCQT